MGLLILNNLQIKNSIVINNLSYANRDFRFNEDFLGYNQAQQYLPLDNFINKSNFSERMIQNLKLINIENPKLDTKYSAKIQQYTKDGIISSESSSISDDTFKCPFTYKSSKDYNFDLILDKRNSAKAAKLRIANYLAKLNDDKDDDEQIDPDELMITINNKEVPNQEILFEKYKSASKSNPEIRFIVNKEVLDLTESNIFLATTKSVFFGSYEIF